MRDNSSREETEMKGGGRVALASCDPFPPVGDDEGPLRAALAAHGLTASDPPWDADVDWSAFDAVLLRTTWDYQFRCDAFVAWCERASRATRLFHGPRIVRWNVDKRYLAALGERGVPLAETLWVAPGEGRAALDEARRRGWSRAFVKPVVGANAAFTLRFAIDAPGFAAALEHIASAPEHAFMLQPYLASVEAEGEVSVIVIDGEPTHGVRKVPAPGDYRVQEDWGARDEAWRPEEAALAIARRAIDVATAILGEPLLYARVDLLVGERGYVLNELELVEPALFFRHGPRAAERLAAALAREVRRPFSAPA